MKFVVSSTALLNVLQTSNKVVSNKNTLPILDNFLFELKDGVLKITASDLETTMIGTLKALGMGNRALQKMFVIRSSFIILRGMVWGNLIGIGLCLLQYFTGWITLDEQGYFLTTLPVSIRWGWVLMLNAGTFVLIVALLSLPTMLISFILPERSIRFE